MFDPAAIEQILVRQHRAFAKSVGLRSTVRAFGDGLLWVANTRDGTVEAVVQGRVDAVESITRWAHRGPEDARVQSVDACAAEGDFAAFEKRPTS